MDLGSGMKNIVGLRGLIFVRLSGVEPGVKVGMLLLLEISSDMERRLVLAEGIKLRLCFIT